MKRFNCTRVPLSLIRIAAVSSIVAAWLIFSMLGILPVSAQSTPVGLRMTVEPDTIYIGDPFTITLTATYPQDYFVVFPRVDPEWRSPNDENSPVFEVRNQTSLPTIENSDGTLTSSIQIEAVLFTTGDIPTPELSVAIRNPDGDIINRPVRPIEVSITPLELGEDEELKDIEPQAVLPVPPDPISFVQQRSRLIIFAGLGALGLAMLALYLWQRRLSSDRPDPSLPAEVALRELDRIASMPLESEPDFKERYTLVSDCLRNYLLSRYYVPAPELTTRQTLEELELSGRLDSAISSLEGILEESDLVKFARFIPNRDDAIRIIERSRDFVRTTGVVPANESSVVATGAGTA
ncbi:MAG: hypothetical protein F4Y49_05230 [Dehalococcoidia bacterium]|nr:hypothetical protein [Dehalococcoidia bacterium]